MKTVIFLYVIIFGYGSTQTSYRVEMPDLKTCQQSLHSSKITNSSGDENESGAVVFCGTDRVQQYGSDYAWFKGRVKND